MKQTRSKKPKLIETPEIAPGRTLDGTPYVFQREKYKGELNVRELPWTPKQKEIISLGLSKHCKALLIDGPAGSSKSIISMYCGLKLLSEKKVSDLQLCRSAVESADNSLGAIPGDVKDKMGVYASPFHEKLNELLIPSQVQALINDSRINIIPPNYCRGLNWASKFVFIEEVQNFTCHQIATCMTRLGEYSKCILAGDSDQSDLPKWKSGWEPCLELFDTEEARENGIYVVRFTEDDIMRSELCKFIVQSFKKLKQSQEQVKDSWKPGN